MEIAPQTERAEWRRKLARAHRHYGRNFLAIAWHMRLSGVIRTKDGVIRWKRRGE